MAEETQNVIEYLKSRKVTCPRMKSLINKQMNKSKRDRQDSTVLRNLGLNKKADTQEQIAKAQEKVADELRILRKKLCPLR